MTESNSSVPYSGNVLVEGLGKIPSPKEALRALLFRPPLPPPLEGMPSHVRIHHLMGIRDLHVPTLVERQLLQTMDLMVRSGYEHRDPRIAATWAEISGEARRTGLRIPAALGAAVAGISGVGKTQACMRSLRSFPRQVIEHASFPKLAGGLKQVVWLSVEVPPSGKAGDLARALMQAWDDAVGGDRFANSIGKETFRNGMRALEEWRQVASAHFLGIVHFDEVQNLFRLKSLQQRKQRVGPSGTAELSVVEDQLLRWLLQLTNSGQLPIVVSGTPDGISALSKRLSTLERINSAGYFELERFKDPKEQTFRTFLRTLGDYQYVRKPLPIDDQLAAKIMEHSAGVPRIIIALWIAAQRVCFERNDEQLLLRDFDTAARTLLAPLVPAVQAIKTDNQIALAQYEDLVGRDERVWTGRWVSNK